MQVEETGKKDLIDMTCEKDEGSRTKNRSGMNISSIKKEGTTKKVIK